MTAVKLFLFFFHGVTITVVRCYTHGDSATQRIVSPNTGCTAGFISHCCCHCCCCFSACVTDVTVLFLFIFSLFFFSSYFSRLQPREKGRMRFHRLQNVQIALDFLKQRQVRETDRCPAIGSNTVSWLVVFSSGHF